MGTGTVSEVNLLFLLPIVCYTYKGLTTWSRRKQLPWRKHRIQYLTNLISGGNDLKKYRYLSCILTTSLIISMAFVSLTGCAGASSSGVSSDSDTEDDTAVSDPDAYNNFESQSESSN